MTSHTVEVAPSVTVAGNRMVLKAVSALLYQRISYVQREWNCSSDNFQCFREDMILVGRMQSTPNGPALFDQLVKPPTVNSIEHFLGLLKAHFYFWDSFFVLAFVYLERFTRTSRYSLNVCTWRPMFLSAIILAQKMADDEPYDLASFSRFYPLLTVHDLRKMELILLTSLEFQTYVAPERYQAMLQDLMTTRSSSHDINRTAAASHTESTHCSILSTSSCKEPSKTVPLASDEIHTSHVSVTIPIFTYQSTSVREEREREHHDRWDACPTLFTHIKAKFNRALSRVRAYSHSLHHGGQDSHQHAHVQTCAGQPVVLMKEQNRPNCGVSIIA
eukprot:GILJ01008890.1.p1 GENE.GILJ01008890.1~~GILJ01008890.1.p1  ORF type:complete len:332 (+),score=17.00 GILJ01008890.1:141-1136(+)